MSIKLDWEIEGERERIHGAGEDPDARRRRRQARIRFLITLVLLLSVIGVAVGAVWLRLRQADWQIEQRLRDSVDAEVAALRLGDRALFLDMQRSASDEWTQRQAAEFDRYQNLKLTQDIQFTGRIVEARVDRLRGRVIVEEIVNGVAYGRVWFYWRYDDGWRHVPPDYTFWGEVRAIAVDGVTVRYRALDEPVAAAIHADLTRWIAFACAALTCPTPPALTIELEPDPTLQTSWSNVDSSVLRVRSPFVVAARLDQPFDRALKLEVARLVATRLTEQTRAITPIPETDAAYLYASITNWLMGRFAEIDTGAYLIDTLARAYGDPSVGVLLQILAPDSNIAVVGRAVGAASLGDVAVDWRDFLTWRVQLERDLIMRGDAAGVAALYDTDEFGRVLVTSRLAAGAPLEPRTIVSVTRETDAAGVPVLRAIAQVGDSDTLETIPFRLVDGVWRRAG
jgi:hypothetical protein